MVKWHVIMLSLELRALIWVHDRIWDGRDTKDMGNQRGFLVAPSAESFSRAKKFKK